MLRPEKLDGWVIESFEIEAQPPFKSHERGYKGQKQFLIDVDPSKIHGDRYWALSTDWMETHCQQWALSIREDYQEQLGASQMKLAPPRCNRLVSPDRNQVYDVIVFTAERGSFIGPKGPQETAERFKQTYQGAKSINGSGIKWVEPDMALSEVVHGYATVQMAVRRYTYRSTFLHAEFGKRRLQDGYLLMLVGTQVFVVVQTLFGPDVKEEQLWRHLSVVLQALRQPAS